MEAKYIPNEKLSFERVQTLMLEMPNRFAESEWWITEHEEVITFIF